MWAVTALAPPLSLSDVCLPSCHPLSFSSSKTSYRCWSPLNLPTDASRLSVWICSLLPRKRRKCDMENIRVKIKDALGYNAVHGCQFQPVVTLESRCYRFHGGHVSAERLSRTAPSGPTFTSEHCVQVLYVMEMWKDIGTFRVVWT